MRKRILVIVLVFLVLSLSIEAGGSARSYAEVEQDETVLNLQGTTWDHAMLRVLIVTEENASWWRPEYEDSVHRASDIWNEAFGTFAANFLNLSYISQVTLIPTVSATVQAGFDIYVSWTTERLGETDEGVGLTVTYSSDGVIVNSTVSLGVNTILGLPLGETDMQNVALHEIGHSLGLEHSSNALDLMYPTSFLGTSARAVSTLNVYGVASVFGWLANPSLHDPGDGWPRVSSVSSPSDIEFMLLPISAENLPPGQTLEPIIGPIQRFFEDVLVYVSFESLFILGVIIVVLAVGWALYKRRKEASRA